MLPSAAATIPAFLRLFIAAPRSIEEDTALPAPLTSSAPALTATAPAPAVNRPAPAEASVVGDDSTAPA